MHNFVVHKFLKCGFYSFFVHIKSVIQTMDKKKN